VTTHVRQLIVIFDVHFHGVGSGDAPSTRFSPIDRKYSSTNATPFGCLYRTVGGSWNPGKNCVCFLLLVAFDGFDGGCSWIGTCRDG
jgi:hypothetical protein